MTTSRLADVHDQRAAACGCCGWKSNTSDAALIHNIEGRIEPGEIWLTFSVQRSPVAQAGAHRDPPRYRRGGLAL